MFMPTFLRNVNLITIFNSYQRIRSVLCKSTVAKSKPEITSSSHKKSDRSKEEVFFPSSRLGGIQNKIALVTGGNDGIGLRCVTELLMNGVRGVMIADTSQIIGRNRVREFSKEYGHNKIAFIQINPANYILLKSDAFISTINFYKGLDIVINNIKFKEKNWEDQVDENIKGVVLSTQLCLEFMGRDNGGRGGILLNIISDQDQNADSCAVHLAVQDFIVRFDRTVAEQHFNDSNVKILTICKATFDSVGCDLAALIAKGPNGCVWTPS